MDNLERPLAGPRVRQWRVYMLEPLVRLLDITHLTASW